MNVNKRFLFSICSYGIFCLVVLFMLVKVSEVMLLHKYNSLHFYSAHQLRLVVESDKFTNEEKLSDDTLNLLIRQVEFIKEQPDRCLDSLSNKVLRGFIYSDMARDLCLKDKEFAVRILGEIQSYKDGQLAKVELREKLNHAQHVFVGNSIAFVVPLDQMVNTSFVILVIFAVVFSVFALTVHMLNMRHIRLAIERFFNNDVTEIMFIDPLTLQILDANNKSLLNLGYLLQKLKRKHLTDISDITNYDAWRNLLAPLVKKESTSVFIETKLRRQDGTFYDAEMRLQLTIHNERRAYFAVVLDVTDRAESEKKLQSALKELQTIQSNLVDGLLMLGPDGSIKSCNKAAARILDTKRGDLLGCYIKSFLPELETGSSGHLLQTVRGSTLNDSTEYRQVSGLTESGKLIPLEMNMQPLNEHGEVSKFVMIIRDISSRKSTENKLKQIALDIEFQREKAEIERQKAEAANAAKSEFLAKMSHEIRSPINGIIGMASYMEDTELTPRQQSCLDTIHTSSKILLTLIEDILDLSKIETGYMESTELPFDLCATIEEITSLAAVNLKNKPVSISIDYDPFLPRKVTGDEAKIRQILLNLIVNAIKFTEQGHVKVSVDLNTEETDRPDYIVRIEDTGIGIAEEDLERIFDDFAQTDTGADTSYGGTGLGLSISRKLARFMGGDVEVESRLGEGSVFQVRLPLTESKESHDGNEYLLWRQVEIPQQKTLIYDCHEGIGAKLGALVETHKHKSVLVDHIDTLKDELGKKKYDQIFYVFPEGNLKDKETKQALISFSHFVNKTASSPIPIILVMPNSLWADESSEEISGVYQGYLTCPLHVDEIEPMMKAVHNANKEGLSDGIVTRRSLHGARGVVKQDDVFKNNRILVAEDSEANRKVLIYLLENLGCEVETAINGQHALERIKEGGDYDVVIMDCRMPVMDGYTATEAIRAYESEMGIERIPILALTANAQKGDREYCLYIGMDDYIEKPVDKAKMVKFLYKWLDGSDNQDGVISNYTPQDEEAPSHEDLDQGEFLAMIAENGEEMARELLSDFMGHIRQELDDLKSALAKSDKDSVLDYAHTLRSLMAQIGASELAVDIEKLEELAGNEQLDECDVIQQEILGKFYNVEKTLEDELLRLLNEGT